MRRVFKYQFSILLLILIGFTSCEKVVELDLNQAKEMLVVDAVVSSIPQQSIVRLSKSSTLFTDEPYQFLSGAKVMLKYTGGDSSIFIETEQGIYKNDDFVGLEGKEYELDIVWGEINVNATSRMPKRVTIDSIEMIVSESGFMGNQERAYSLKVHFTDSADEINYYRFDVLRNDTVYDGFVVSKDLYYNGLSTYQFFMNYEMKELDTIGVQLSCIDEANYNYFLVLSQSNSPFTIAPGNPVSNLQGNAIGYFGAYAQDRKSIIVPPKSAMP